MISRVISAIEIICLVIAIYFAIRWVNEPTGDFEPMLAFCSILIVALDFIRRIIRSSELRVFLSVGATYTKAQETYVKTFERFLSESKCKRLVVGRDCPSARQPILQVRDLMQKADAVVILAFTRYDVKSATEKPNADRPNHKSIEIKNVRYPTVWNQIEAAIAFGMKIPLLIIVEEGLKQEAMLKDRNEFRTIETTIDPEFFESEAFKSRFNDFVKISRKRSWFRFC
ncbi:conserved hypothetical protein, membrane [Candidatus Magnetomorum sp. HK-1]|nr:conserved hypothetical protein, membrane [Candidatus Magnetomorum sp. HK-1]